MQVEPIYIAAAGVAIPLVGFAFKLGVRWVINGTYVRKDVFASEMKSLHKEIKFVRETTDRIMDHLLKG